MLLEGNANDIVQTMRRADTGAAITDGVLTCKVYDPHWNLIDTVSMSHSGSGEYRGTSSVSYGVGVLYTFDIKASNYLFRRIKRETAIAPEV
jgi:hypothetical protein